MISCVWFRAQVVLFLSLWYSAFDKKVCRIINNMWLSLRCWPCVCLRDFDVKGNETTTRQDYFCRKQIYSIEHNRTISNHSRTAVIHMKTSFCNTTLFRSTVHTVQYLEVLSFGGQGEIGCHYKTTLATTCSGVSLFRRFSAMVVFLLQWRIFWRRLRLHWPRGRRATVPGILKTIPRVEDALKKNMCVVKAGSTVL